MSQEMALSPGRSPGTALDCPVPRHMQKPCLAFTPNLFSSRSPSPPGCQSPRVSGLRRGPPNQPPEDPAPPTPPPSGKALGGTVCVTPGFEVGLLPLFLCCGSPGACPLSLTEFQRIPWHLTLSLRVSVESRGKAETPSQPCAAREGPRARFGAHLLQRLKAAVVSIPFRPRVPHSLSCLAVRVPVVWG